MGFWTGIKRAINSTLGTSSFKPLDKIIKDVVDGQRTLAASDSVIKVINSTPSSISNTFLTSKNGSVRIIATLYGGDNIIPARVWVYDTFTNQTILELTSYSANGIVQSGDINVVAEKRYGISVTHGTATIKIGANVVDTSLVKVI